MSAQSDRNARLDQLKAAANEYTEKKLKRLDAESEFLESVLKSRTGVGQVSNQGVNTTAEILADSIQQFLE